MTARLLLVLFSVSVAVQAQSVTTGSTGIDGALVLTTPGTVVFDPRTFNPPLNAAGDNVYHFTSIYIGAGVTVQLSAKILGGPVFWLAQGSVQIDGVIDLNGEDGSASTQFPNNAGSGGYAGAAGRVPKRLGYGPGAADPGGFFTGNQFLVPLIGGSGGAGGEICGGGAGGGALLISSATSISVNGAISANGGAGGPCGAGGGSGGAIRLVAPIIDGKGILSAKGGKPEGGDGRVRLEALTNNFSGSVNDTPTAWGKPFGLFLPPTHPASVRVVDVGGLPVTTPEFTIKQTSPVMIMIEASFIPPGTAVQLEFFPENGPTQTITTSPLDGTFELSRATALVTFPGGSSRCYVKATWKQPIRGPLSQ